MLVLAVLTAGALSLALAVITCAPEETFDTVKLVEHVVTDRQVLSTLPSIRTMIDLIPLASLADAEIVTLPFLGTIALFCGWVIATNGGVVSEGGGTWTVYTVCPVLVKGEIILLLTAVSMIE